MEKNTLIKENIINSHIHHQIKDISPLKNKLMKFIFDHLMRIILKTYEIVLKVTEGIRTKILYEK